MDVAFVRVGLLIPHCQVWEAMAQAYSGNARSRVLKAAFDGSSTHQAAIRFGVGATTATPWLWRFGRAARPPRGSRLDANADFILSLVEAGSTRRLPSKEL